MHRFSAGIRVPPCKADLRPVFEVQYFHDPDILTILTLSRSPRPRPCVDTDLQDCD